MEQTKITETFEMTGPRNDPVRVTVHFEKFANDPLDYWHSAQTDDGQIVEPWKDGTFQKGDGTILRAGLFPEFTRKLPTD